MERIVFPSPADASLDPILFRVAPPSHTNGGNEERRKNKQCWDSWIITLETADTHLGLLPVYS